MLGGVVRVTVAGDPYPISASGRIRRDAWEIAYPKIRTV